MLRWRSHGGLPMLVAAAVLAGLTALTRDNGLQFLTTVLVNAETPRFRTPLEPCILLLAALGLHYLAVLAERRIPRRRLATALR